MKKLLLILLCLLSAALIAAMPFLCAHSDILPEVSTAYYELKALQDAITATGPEAELMRMLLGVTADTVVTPVSSHPELTWFGVVLAMGAVAALGTLFVCNLRKRELHAALLWAGALAVPFGLIGARLVYCLVNLPFYLKDIAAPEAMLKVWEGGLSLSGALFFIALAGVIGAKLGRASTGRVLNELAIPMLIFCGTAAMGCAQIDMGFGPEVSAAFSIFTTTIGETLRLHTTTLVVLAALVLCWINIGLDRPQRKPDASFALTAFLYGTVMILLESLRKDGHMVWGFVHAEMLLDLAIALPALLYLAGTKKRILWSLLATAALAGAVVALEFALDRSSIGDGLLYAGYVALLAAYMWLGWRFSCKARKAA